MIASTAIILWFRRDLRLADNHALAAAVSDGRPVIPLFILETDNDGALPYGAAQSWWLHHSLTKLGESLGARDTRLLLRRGSAKDVLSEIIRETGASAIYWNRRHDPDGMRIDTSIKSDMRAAGVEVRSFAGQLLHDPSRLKTKAGGAYKVFTPFWRVLSAGEPDTPIDAPSGISAPASFPASDNLNEWALLPRKPDWANRFGDTWTPGEKSAHDKLAAFVDQRLGRYGHARDFPGISGTSRLSPHLTFGEISPSQIWHAARTSREKLDSEGVSVFRKELAWRDFSYHLLFHNPDLASRSLDRRFEVFGWRDDDEGFHAWTRGKTGFPIVDAGMRQLWDEGYMHNRVRMITASFLIKDLLIDWRRGMEWFRSTLLDADPASNSASWQWVAGCGADAAPFFRIFNPVLQGQKFDPDGTYVKHYVPELSRVPAKFVHRPFEAPLPVLQSAGVCLGADYPAPIVEHRSARDRALTAFAQIQTQDRTEEQ